MPFKKVFSYLFFNSLITISILILSSIANFLFVKVAALYLAKSSFGTLICVVNLMMMMMVPFGAFQIFTSRHVSASLTENAFLKAYLFFKRGIQASILCSFFLAGVSFFFASQLSYFFRTDSKEVFQLISIIILLILPFLLVQFSNSNFAGSLCLSILVY